MRRLARGMKREAPALGVLMFAGVAVFAPLIGAWALWGEVGVFIAACAEVVAVVAVLFWEAGG